MNFKAVLVFVFIVSTGSGRSVTNAPCFMVDTEDSTVQSKTNMLSIKPIFDQIRILKNHSESRVRQMELDYCVDGEEGGFLNIQFSSSMDKRHFLHDYISDKPSFLTSIRKHYIILNLLANYLEELQGAVAERTAKDYMFLTQDYIYNVMCTIKVVLRSQDQDPQCKVPAGKVSSMIYKYRKEKANGDPNRCLEMFFEYFTARDCNKVARYLESLYNYILDYHKIIDVLIK